MLNKTRVNENLKVTTPTKWMNGWDKYFKKLLEKPIDDIIDNRVMNPAVAILLCHIREMDQPLKVLDLAAGAGKTTCILAEEGCSVDACDALQSAVKLIQKRAEAMDVSERVSVKL